MSTASASVSEFGKDLGVVHEAIITGRKVGAGRTFWSRLAHNEGLFRRVFKDVMQMMVVTTRPFEPTFIGKKWSIIAKERDKRSEALPEVDFSQIVFETCLQEGEPSIKGEEKLKRLKARGKIRLGSSVFRGLWENYTARKEESVLECLYKEQDITYFDFFGDVLLGPEGDRDVLYFLRGGNDQWDWAYSCLEDEWDAGGFSASLANQVLGLEVQTS